MKNIFISILIILFYTTSIALKAQTMQSSSWSINQTLEGFSLDKNIGERSMTIYIKFENPFNKKPQIVLSVTQIDSDKDSNCRYNVEAISISRDGFTLKVHTWGDSKLFSVSGYWVGFTK